MKPPYPYLIMGMATLKQRTSFGPGIYRGHQFTADRLREFVDGTNKAIAAGVPIPLLKRHAPINASDDDTEQFANSDEGAGWITKVELEPETGAIAWEATVPDSVVKAKEEGTLKFTSPEFRPHYECEKAGVYTGPVIRHFAFTPKPGNPHQGAIETVALEEQVGCFQFSEEDYEGPVKAYEEGEAEAFGEGITDEGIWDKAKKAAGTKYKGKHRWAVVSSIYKKMGGKYKSKENPQPHTEGTQHGEDLDEGDDASSSLLKKHGWKFKGEGVFTHDQFPKHKIVYHGPHLEHHQAGGSKYVLNDHPALARHLAKFHKTSQHAEHPLGHVLSMHGFKHQTTDNGNSVYAHPNHPGHSIVTTGGHDWEHHVAGGKKGSVKYHSGNGTTELDKHLGKIGSGQYGEDLDNVKHDATIDTVPDSEYTGSMDKPTHDQPNTFGTGTGQSLDKAELVEVEANGGVPKGTDKNKTDPALHEVDICPECGSNHIATSPMGQGLTCQECNHYWQRQSTQHSEHVPPSYVTKSKHHKALLAEGYEYNGTGRGDLEHHYEHPQTMHSAHIAFKHNKDTKGTLHRHSTDRMITGVHNYVTNLKRTQQHTEANVAKAKADSKPSTEQHAESEADIGAFGKSMRTHGYKEDSVRSRAMGHTVYAHPSGHTLSSNKGKWTHKQHPGGEVTELRSLKDVAAHLNKVHGSQHAEKPIDEREGIDNIDSKAETNPPDNTDKPESPPVESTSTNPEDPKNNPDMPPKATDKSKLAAILAGLAQKNVVLPSDWDPCNDGAMDILLGCLNSAIKAEQTPEAQEPDEDDGAEQPKDAPMPFAENESQFSEEETHKVLTKHGYKSIDPKRSNRMYHHDIHPHSFKTYEDGSWTHYPHMTGPKPHPEVVHGNGHSELKAHLRSIHGATQHTEQFTEEELAALPPKARAVIEAGVKALQAEQEAKAKAEQEALQYAEAAKQAKAEVAKQNAVNTIAALKLPPKLSKDLIASYATIQFNEDAEQPTFTATQVAQMVANALPPALQFEHTDTTDATKPNASRVVGKDPNTNEPYVQVEKDSEQFFEEGATFMMTAEKANEIANATTLGARRSYGHQTNGQPGFVPSVATLVAKENAANPNNVMRN